MKVLNGIGIFFAVILSIVLVLTAVCAVLTSTVSSVVQPDSIADFVQNIDYTEFIADEGDFSLVLEEMNLDESVVNELMQSDAVDEIVSTYAEGFSAAIMGEDIPEGLTPDKLKDIFDRNMDEIVEIAGDSIPEGVSEEEFRQEISTVIDESADQLMEVLPEIEEFTADISEVGESELEIIRIILGPMLTIVFTVASVILAALIYVCRLKNFKGFLWIGVDSLVAALIVGSVAISLGTLKSMLVDAAAIDMAVLDSALGVFREGLVWGMIILGVVAAVCIAGYVLLKKKVVNRKKEVVESAA